MQIIKSKQNCPGDKQYQVKIDYKLSHWDSPVSAVFLDLFEKLVISDFCKQHTYMTFLFSD